MAQSMRMRTRAMGMSTGSTARPDAAAPATRSVPMRQPRRAGAAPWLCLGAAVVLCAWAGWKWLGSASHLASSAPQPPAVYAAPSLDAATLLGVHASPQAAAPAAPPAPPLPFTFIGSWSAGRTTVVYLRRDDRPYTIKGPGRIDADYAVVAIERDRMTLKYLPTGALSHLKLEAGAVAHAGTRAAGLPTASAVLRQPPSPVARATGAQPEEPQEDN